MPAGFRQHVGGVPNSTASGQRQKKASTRGKLAGATPEDLPPTSALEKRC